jgi:catechol 2,3-dioxygenase-like lactoylglutathione lyase family enzyme
VVTRIGHVALHVRDIDRSIAFFAEVLGLRVTLRDGNRAYLTCNERHHELILIASGERGYDHIALEVDDLERAEAALRAAGVQVLAHDHDEPGVQGALRAVVPGGHVVKLFTGMEHVPGAAAADGAHKFEHISLNLRDLAGLERLLVERLGFRLSDCVRPMLSWLHCNHDHHGIALQRFPVSRLHHYAWAFADFGALGRAADRAAAADAQLVYGLGRHGPGNNHFIYFKDPDGFLIECCSELAQLVPGGTYELGRKWTVGQTNLWGPGPPPAFLLAGRPLARSSAGHAATPRRMIRLQSPSSARRRTTNS